VREAPVPQRRVLTVSELTGLVRISVETGFSEVWLEGELSNLRAPGSGHLYCTLKDDSCQIRAVIFRSAASRLRFALEDGLHIVARGRITVYEPRGEYQIVVEHAEPKGVGALQLAFEQLKHRLATEGLFDLDRKRALPFCPRTVGMVTSATGAAVQDMITVLHRRCPLLRIILVPVQVQGEGAAQQIADGIAALNALDAVEVIIVGRGGGSAEDLWSFNEETVVRAIVGSRVPVVSAVGHETDVTLADFAADVRAPTPSAAAEAVVPVLADVLERLGELEARCHQAINHRCADERQRLELLVSHVAKIRFAILDQAQRVDGAVLQMTHALQRVVKLGREQVHGIEQNLMRRSPQSQVRHGLAIVPQLRARLQTVMQHHLGRRLQETRGCMENLHHLSPLATMLRGYSIIEDAVTRQVIQSTRQATVGQVVVAHLSNGQLRCTVKGTVDRAV
jgi:exodeoxyribonuclease VII large subunit